MEEQEEPSLEDEGRSLKRRQRGPTRGHYWLLLKTPCF